MAGVGFSVGDIIAAGKLAKDIYENCFTREQAAGEPPNQFSVHPRLPLSRIFQGCRETLGDSCDSIR